MGKRDYRFLRKEKDPIIDLMRTEAQRQGMRGEIAKGQIMRLSRISGVSDSAIRAWFYGDTLRPQSLSSRFVMAALGITVKYFGVDGREIGHNSMRPILQRETTRRTV